MNIKMFEFMTWLDRCAEDGKAKLGLTPDEITWALLDQARKVLLWKMIDEGIEKGTDHADRL